MASKTPKTSAGKGKTPTAASKLQSVEAGVQTTIPFDVKPHKRHIVTSFNNLTSDLQELLLLKYPLGWRNHVIKVNKSGGFFYAITLDTPEVDYLIKVDVETDSRQKLEEDRSIFGSYADEEEDETDELPSKDDEQIADDTPDENND